MKTKHYVLPVFGLMILSFNACKKSTDEAYCTNGLLRIKYEDCKCLLNEEYILPTQGDAADCRKLENQEWIFTLNDTEFPFKKLVFEYLDTSKVLYPHSGVVEGYEAEFAGYGMLNLDWNENNKKQISGNYYITYDEHWNASIVVDFRYRWAEEESSSFSQSTKEGFFITLELINGKPENVRLNRGEPLETENRNVVSSTSIQVSK